MKISLNDINREMAVRNGEVTQEFESECVIIAEILTLRKVSSKVVLALFPAIGIPSKDLTPPFILWEKAGFIAAYPETPMIQRID